MSRAGPDASQASALEVLRSEIAVLHESEARLRRAVAATSGYHYSLRLEEGRAVDVRHGDGCLALTGYSSAELEAEPALWLEMVLPEDRPRVEARARRLDAGEDCPPIEYRLRRKDGSVCWVSNATVVHRGPDGRALGLDGFARDISERKNAEQALRTSEGRLRAIFKAAPIGIGVVVDRSLTQVNDRFCQMVGFAQGELIGRSSRVVYPSDEEFELVGRQKYRQIAESGAGSVETRFRRKDGAIIDVLLSSTPIDPADLAAGVIFTALDITERKAAEQALRQQHSLLLRIADTSPVAITVLDREGRITFCNAAAERVLGVARGDAARRTFQASEWRISDLGGQPFPEEALPFNRVMQTRRPVWGVRHAIESAEGRRSLLSINAAPISNEAGEVEAVVATLEDITQQVAAARENAELQAQFLQSQKMEVIGRLAGGVAHDFNNLLTAFVGYSEFALRLLAHDHPARPHVLGIRRAADRATALTHQLLAFARKQRSEPRPIDLNALIEQSQRMAARIIGEDVALVFEPGPELWPVRADPGQVDQIILNLATNARDAMPDGGRLTLTTANVPASDAPASTGGRPHGDMVRLSVRDTGVGMSAELQARALEPFFTTKERGTGLGLSTVRDIAERHGARLEIVSTPGAGTCVSLLFPRVDAAELEVAGASREAALPGGSETVLLVEDDPAVRQIARDFLESLGYTVLEAADGPAALGIAATTPGEIQLLVSDVVLPGADGAQVYEALRQGRPKMKQLFISGYAGDAVARHGILEQDVRLLQKPFTLDALATRVREALDA